MNALRLCDQSLCRQEVVGTASNKVLAINTLVPALSLANGSNMWEQTRHGTNFLRH